MGKSQEQTVGYKYFLGQHLIAASNKLVLLAVRVQEKLAWEGTRGGSNRSIYINKPELFGGEGREGGVKGQLDILDGRSTQARNSYLQRVLGLGNDIPAFRYMTSFVLRQMYVGNNPYPKPFKFLVRDDQIWKAWLPQLGQITQREILRDAFLTIVLDTTLPQTEPNWIILRDGAAAYVRSLKGTRNNVQIYGQGYTPGDFAPGKVIRRYNCTDQDYEDIAVWIETKTFGGAGADLRLEGLNVAVREFMGITSTETGYTLAIDESDVLVPSETVANGGDGGDRIVMMIGRGLINNPQQNQIDNLKAIPGMNFQLIYSPSGNNSSFENIFDNTPNDVPPSGGTADGTAAAARRNQARWIDINPIHIFYDLITGTTRRANENTDLIGDSMAAAAAILFNENFGLSFFYRSDDSVSEFIKNIERHIDGRLFFSQQTGKYEVKLIRNDYNVNDLFVFDQSNVTKWGTDISKEVEYDLPNQLTVVYRNPRDGKKRSLTLQAEAAITQAGGIIRPDKVEFEGLYSNSLASRIARREYVSRVRPKWSGTITVSHAPSDLNLGSAFMINNPILGINNVVCRVSELKRFGEKSRAVEIQFVQDRFNIDADVDIEVEEVEDEELTPLAADARVAEEAPYYFLARNLGDQEAESQVTNDPNIGYLHSTWAAPSLDHIGAAMFVDTGGGWRNENPSLVSPGKQILNALTVDATSRTIEISDTLGIESIRPGSLACLNGEYMRIDGVNTTTDPITLTVGRGCLDTPPRAHAIGDTLIFCGEFLEASSIAYTSGETANVKIITRVATGALPINAAPTDVVTFGGRAARPYPPGNVRLNGQYLYQELPTGVLTVTWAHRDRTMQTTGNPDDYLAGNIGPEAGTTYTLRVIGVDDTGAEIGSAIEEFTGLTGTSQVLASTKESLLSGRPEAATNIKFEVVSIVAGRNSVPSTVLAEAFAPPRNFSGVIV